MRRKVRKSLIRPSLNFLSDTVLKAIVAEGKEVDDGPRNYNKEVDSDEAFKYRRKEDDERKSDYQALVEAGMSAQQARTARDFGHDHVMDLLDHKDMPYWGLTPEWTEAVFGQAVAQEQLKEMKQDYMKVGIHKEPGEPLDAQEATRLNEYYKTVGKPEIEIPDESKYNAAKARKEIEERNPMRKADEYIKKADDVDGMVARQNRYVKEGRKELAADLAEKIGQLRRNAGPSEKDLKNKATGEIWRQQKESLKTPDGLTKSLISRINRFVKENKLQRFVNRNLMGHTNDDIETPEEKQFQRQAKKRNENIKRFGQPEGPEGITSNMEKRLVGERYAEPPNSIEVAQKSNPEKIRYDKVYNNCIWSSKYSYGHVYSISLRSRELCTSIYPIRDINYPDFD